MKMFKKLMAVALVAVMALSMFTACGLSKDDMKDALKDKTGLTYDSSLADDAAFKSVKETFDDFGKGEKESKISDKLDEKIKAVTPTTGTAILYATDGDETSLAKDINNQIAKLEADNKCEYKTFYFVNHNGSKKENNAVLVIVSTATKAN